MGFPTITYYYETHFTCFSISGTKATQLHNASGSWEHRQLVSHTCNTLLHTSKWLPLLKSLLVKVNLIYIVIYVISTVKPTQIL